ncbi:MAG: hypothetical protein AAF390_06220 [Pseudomonadota bacterium]
MQRRGPSAHVAPEAWLRHLFSAKAAVDGGVVRRKVRDVEQIVGRAAFETDSGGGASAPWRIPGNTSCSATGTPFG